MIAASFVAAAILFLVVAVSFFKAGGLNVKHETDEKELERSANAKITQNRIRESFENYRRNSPDDDATVVQKVRHDAGDNSAGV